MFFFNCFFLDESDQDTGIERNDDDLIRYYFNAGFPYKEVLQHLERFDIHLSKRTLLRRLVHLGLRRRRRSDRQYNDENVRRRIEQIVNGPGSSGGYRTVWHTLRLEGYQVPRCVVQNLLKLVDPDGTVRRRRNKLKRRQYRNPGPNYAWHIDGYDKLKPFGFPIHGCIDGFSRKILWLEVTRSNNSPDNIASMYLKAVQDYGCPVELVTDLGTENVIVAVMQSFFRDNSDAHRYVPSPRNQRIESWWSHFSRSRSLWWREFFADLERRGTIDLACELSKECLIYVFSPLIQMELDRVKEHWNTHYIRKSQTSIPGRPDSLYYLPQNYGALDMRMEVDEGNFQYASTELVVNEYDNDYTDYFDYVTRYSNVHVPTTWFDALNIYKFMMNSAT